MWRTTEYLSKTLTPQASFSSFCTGKRVSWWRNAFCMQPEGTSHRNPPRTKETGARRWQTQLWFLAFAEFSLMEETAKTCSNAPVSHRNPVNYTNDTCKRLKVAFAKYPLLLWRLGGENNAVHHCPFVQSVHKSHSLSQHQLSCRQKSIMSLTKPEIWPLTIMLLLVDPKCFHTVLYFHPRLDGGVRYLQPVDRAGLNVLLTCGQVLLPASPLDIRVDDEQPVWTLSNFCNVLLLKQLLHLAVINKIFLLLLLGRCCVSTFADLISVSPSRCRQDKRPDRQKTRWCGAMEGTDNGAGPLQGR